MYDGSARFTDQGGLVVMEVPVHEPLRLLPRYMSAS